MRRDRDENATDGFNDTLTGLLEQLGKDCYVDAAVPLIVLLYFDPDPILS